jgi:pyridoxamine 5'-phosphate oxidase
VTDEGDHRQARREYQAATLSRAALPADPLTQFGAWIEAATEVGAKDATAMALATVREQGGTHSLPSVRIVLLKHYDARGLVWYTDYKSQKGAELTANPMASGLFYWRDFDRQVRVTGRVEKVDASDSEAYFHSRPADSRFSAAASMQSQPVANRQSLEARVAELMNQYPDEKVPRPDNWGGYCLVPDSFEFWQGRAGRLHDRFLYTRNTRIEGAVEAGAGQNWRIERLQP